jgi:isopenicillin-N epimerase
MVRTAYPTTGGITPRVNDLELSRSRDPADDDAWRDLAAQWQIRADTTMLNHGSFGLCPSAVAEAQRHWLGRLQSQPMDFFVRQYEPAWLAAREKLAGLVGTATENLIFVENATQAMNIVAQSLPLQESQVVLTNHEYGAVRRTWERTTAEAKCDLITAKLPFPLSDEKQIVGSILNSSSARRRIFVVSHITSATATKLPIEALVCDQNENDRNENDIVLIDGPHAIAQLPLNLDDLNCDFYAASCHKWLCGASGSGFLYVHPRWHAKMKPLQMSWGRIRHDLRNSNNWWEEFMWSGTRDPSAWLSLPAAIDFLANIGWEPFRLRCMHLANYAREQLTQFSADLPAVAASSELHTFMAHMPLPAGDAASLQNALWQRYGIEVPIIHWLDNRWIRVSCHLYNTKTQIDYLCAALRQLLGEENA